MLTATFKKRLITSVILAPIIIWAVFFVSFPVFCFVLAVITSISLWEWTLFMGLRKLTSRLALFIFMLVLFATSAYFAYGKEVLRTTGEYYLASMILVWAFCFYFVANYRGKEYEILKNQVLMFFLGIFLLFSFWLSLVIIRKQVNGQWWIVYIFFIVWGADVGAYLFGKLWGKKKLIPHVSPKKTIAGFWGGLLFSILIASIFGWFLVSSNKNYIILIIFTIITVLFSIVGDLFISILKRHQGLKDTGIILPGHGGLLDRIDSSLAALPIFASGILALGFVV